jgi:hypothetical protein
MHLKPIHIKVSVKQTVFQKCVAFIWIEPTPPPPPPPHHLNRRYVHENHIRHMDISFICYIQLRYISVLLWW